MNHPKYTLKYLPDRAAPFVIFENMKMISKIASRAEFATTTFDDAIRKLGELGGEVTLAWSTKSADNSFTV